MPNEEVTHKLITQHLRIGYLNELILCWNYYGAPSPDQTTHTRYVVSINDATCPKCIDLWKAGHYA